MSKSRSSKEREFIGLVRSATLTGGELWFPERLSGEFLASQKERLGPYLYSCLYQNDPSAPEDQRFLPAWIVYDDFRYEWAISPRIILKHTGDEIPVYVSTTVDPAFSERRYADYTGIVTLGTDPDGNWWILHYQRVRGSTDVITEACIREVREFHPQRFGIEDFSFQHALKELIDQGFADNGVITRTMGLKVHGRRGKTLRIEKMIPRFSRGQVFFMRGLGTELETELRDWRPNVEMEHDDLIDALSYQEDISMPAPLQGLVPPAVDILDLPPEQREMYRKKAWGDSGRDPYTGY